MKNNNLIAISGKLGSGKDLVGRIIQYHIGNLRNQNHWSKDALLLSNPKRTDLFRQTRSGFEIKKFADKLKDIVCILIGCTKEQLEDREFKEKELGKEWWYIKKWYPANPNKDKVFTLIPYIDFDSRIFDGDDSCRWEVIKTTPRLLLQLIGTECGRQIIHPNVWVNSLFSEYKVRPVTLPDETTFIKDEEKWFQERTSNWIITDLRFSNELKAIEDRGGISIRIERISCPNCSSSENYCVKTNEEGEEYIICEDCEYSNWGDTFDEKDNQHESETALDKAEFDYVIHNNGTLESLIEKVKEILIKEKVI